MNWVSAAFLVAGVVIAGIVGWGMVTGRMTTSYGSIDRRANRAGFWIWTIANVIPAVGLLWAGILLR